MGKARGAREGRKARRGDGDGTRPVGALLEEEVRAYYGGGRSRHLNLRIAPGMLVAIARVERELSRAVGRPVSRAAAGRAMMALGLACYRRGDRRGSAS